MGGDHNINDQPDGNIRRNNPLPEEPWSHGTTDAMVWAKQFMRVFLDKGDWIPHGTVTSLDPGQTVKDLRDLVRAWFANAIETGRDAATRQMSYTPFSPAEDAIQLLRRTADALEKLPKNLRSRRGGLFENLEGTVSPRIMRTEADFIESSANLLRKAITPPGE